jgi:phospholipase C
MNSKWPARFVRLPLLPLGCILILAGCGGGGGSGTPPPTPGATGLQRVNHIIVMMQENHSFDNYFGALPYSPGLPYHAGPCASTDNKCVDALTCTASGASLACTNSNPENDGAPPVVSFHDPLLCIPTDLDHSWVGTHQEINFLDPNNSLHGTNDGFVEDNDGTDAPDTGESATDDHTMGFYTQADLPFYYSIAQTFALDDRYFATLPGPTVPNRMYLYAATSFGHLVTSTAEAIPPAGGYKSINGTILDLLNKQNVSWGEICGRQRRDRIGHSIRCVVSTSRAAPFSDRERFHVASRLRQPAVGGVCGLQPGQQ